MATNALGMAETWCYSSSQWFIYTLNKLLCVYQVISHKHTQFPWRYVYISGNSFILQIHPIWCRQFQTWYMLTQICQTMPPFVFFYTTYYNYCKCHLMSRTSSVRLNNPVTTCNKKNKQNIRFSAIIHILQLTATHTGLRCFQTPISQTTTVLQLFATL